MPAVMESDNEHAHTCTCALGDCLTSRPKGRSRPRELWFSIYSCTLLPTKWTHVHVHTLSNCTIHMYMYM